MGIPVGWGNMEEIMKNLLWKELVLEATSEKILLAIDLIFFLSWVIYLKESFGVLHMYYHLHNSSFSAS